MIPTIFQIGPLPINSFGLAIALAVIAAIYRLSLSFEVVGLEARFAETFVFTGTIVGLIGARLWYLAEHYSEIRSDFWGAAFSSAGFTFYGGFIFALVAVVILARFWGVPVHKIADACGPTLALGYAIGRLGCQLSGDGDYGFATDSWFSMSYSSGVVPTPPGVLVYPTPVLESLMALVVMWALLRVEPRVEWQPPWRRFGLYLVLISLERFAIEFLRVERKFALGLSEAQYIAMILITLGAVLVLRRSPGISNPERV